MSAEARLKERGITLPQPSTPLANYVGAVRTGNLLYLAGHGPLREGKASARGKLGRDMTVEQGIRSPARSASISWPRRARRSAAWTA
jgi:enamine deaminase RidA (YjgF/YER057c/UK114 family)